mgnify:CR=1 FL=1
MYICGPKWSYFKNPGLWQFQKLLHWKAHMPKSIPRHQNQPPSFDSFEVMSRNVYFQYPKRPFGKNPDLPRIRKFHHCKAYMPKPGPQRQNQPLSYYSFEVTSESVHFRSQKRPFWKIQTSHGFENFTIGKLICQNLVEDTKISLLAIIVLKL